MQENSRSLNNQAILFAKNGEYQEAIACLKRAITVEKSNSLLWFNLAITYRDAGDLDNAINTMEYAYRLNPEDEEILENLANLHYAAGNNESALSYAVTGLEKNSMNPHFWNTAGVVYFSVSSFDDAAEFFEHAVFLSPNYYDAIFNLRDTYVELNNTAGVEECSRKLAELSRGGLND